MHLYKYKPFNCHSIRMIEKGEIFLASPDRLNDPLDCTLLESWLEHIKSKLQAKYGDDHLGCEMFEDPITHEVNPLLDAVKLRLSRIGVFSLAGQYDEPIMWSHYADEHRGVCVGFDQNKLERLIRDDVGYNKDRRLITLQQVSYEQTPPYDALIERIVDRNYRSGRPVHRPESLFVDLLVSAMTTKSEHWKYEQERRILLHLNKANGFQAEILQIPTECIVEVNIGFRTPDAVVRQIEDIRRVAELSHIEINRMEFDEDSFRMRKSPI